MCECGFRVVAAKYSLEASTGVKDDHVACILCKPSCWSCRRDVSPQQDNYDDCGVFAVMIGSQLGACADMHLIQAQLAMQFRFYIALCVIKQWLRGVVVAPATAQARAATAAGKSLNSILTVAS